MRQTMPIKSKGLACSSCTMSVLFLGLLAHVLPTSVTASILSPQEQTGNITGEMHLAPYSKIARLPDDGANITGKATEANTTGLASGVQQVSTAPERASNSQSATSTRVDEFQTQGQLPRTKDLNPAQIDEFQNEGQLPRTKDLNPAQIDDVSTAPERSSNSQSTTSTRVDEIQTEGQLLGTKDLNPAQIDEIQTEGLLPGTKDLNPAQIDEIQTEGQLPGTKDLNPAQIDEIQTEGHLPRTKDLNPAQIDEIQTEGQLPGTKDFNPAQIDEIQTEGQLLGTKDLNPAQIDEIQTEGQLLGTKDLNPAQINESETVESPDWTRLPSDWVPPCVGSAWPPTPPSKTSDCPPSIQISEALEGTIEWNFDLVDCSQEHFVLIYRIPEEYGFVLEFHQVHIQAENDYMLIYGVANSTQMQTKTTNVKLVDLSPHMLHTNIMHVVLCSEHRWARSKFHVSYKAHPRSSIPKFIHRPMDKLVYSKNIHHCYGMTNLPEAISCDGVPHCEHGEDEENCTYRDEGCGDWYPHNDQCIKATFLGVADGLIMVPSKAEEACQLQDAATLAAFTDSAGQELMADMIRKSGFWTAVVGIRRVQPVSAELSHLYRFLWQWGQPGSPIAYEQLGLQREDAFNGCAKLSVVPLPSLKPVSCYSRSERQIGYVCMRPNPQRHSDKLTLPGIALPVPSSVPEAFPTKTCPDGSLVQTFHSCQWGRQEEEEVEDESITGGLSPSNFPLFQCRYGPSIHYSFLCDGKDDCVDRSDEMDCQPPRFSPLLNSSFICQNFQNVAKETRCDGIKDCFDGSDEDLCASCIGKTLCRALGCLPDNTAIYIQDCPPNLVKSSYDYDPESAHVVLDGYGLSLLQPISVTCFEGFFQCQSGFCIPIFLLNNGEQDCPKGEDEGIPMHNMTCPGYYRCQGVGTCVHKTHVCDGVQHCPYKDDELYCNLTCPRDSGCVCEGHAYKCSKMINPLDNLHVRYLDLSFAANVSLDNVHFMEYLVFLNLSFCRLVSVTVRDMPQLQTLDLSSNLLTRLSSLSLVTLSGVTYLDLSHNPMVKTLTAEFTAMLQVGELQNLRTLKLVNLSLEAIDSRVFSPLSNLNHLDLRTNQLRRYSEESLHGLVSLDDLYTDESKLCCPYFHSTVSRCHAPVDELSSCSDLLGKDIYRVCLWTLAVLALVGNVGVLLYRLLLVRTRIPLTAASILVKNLCASDMLMGVYLAMIGVADAELSGTYVSREREWKSSVMCTVAGVLSLVSSEVSALVISLITLDRVLVLCFPFRPEFRLTPRATVMSCLAVWVAGVVLAAVPILTGMEFYGQTSICIPLPITRQQFSGQFYAFGVFIILNFAIFLFIGAGQLMIYWAVRKVSVETGAARQSRDTTVARRLFLIVLTDFCCWFPVGVMGLLAARATPIPGEVNVWAAIFVLPLNSALNPFLYTLNALLERLRARRKEMKMKKIVAIFRNEIWNLNAATVKDVMRMCVRTGQVEKEAVDRMFETTASGQSKADLNGETTPAGRGLDSEEFSNSAFDSVNTDLSQIRP